MDAEVSTEAKILLKVYELESALKRTNERIAELERWRGDDKERVTAATEFVVRHLESEELPPGGTQLFPITGTFPSRLVEGQSPDGREFIRLQFRLLVDGIEVVPEGILFVKGDGVAPGTPTWAKLCLREVKDEYGRSSYELTNMDSAAHRFSLWIIPWPKDVKQDGDIVAAQSDIAKLDERMKSHAPLSDDSHETVRASLIENREYSANGFRDVNGKFVSVDTRISELGRFAAKLGQANDENVTTIKGLASVINYHAESIGDARNAADSAARIAASKQDRIEVGQVGPGGYRSFGVLQAVVMTEDNGFRYVSFRASEPLTVPVRK